MLVGVDPHPCPGYHQKGVVLVEGEDGEKPSEVSSFLRSLGIEGHDEKFADLKALLYDTKTEKLKEFGMSVQQRKKLLSHVEKYKRGLWAPDAMR